MIVLRHGVIGKQKSKMTPGFCFGTWKDSGAWVLRYRAVGEGPILGERC